MLNQPFFQITLPLMVTFIVTVWLASWSQNKRIDEISKRIDSLEKRLESIERRLEAIETSLRGFAERIVKLEVAKWH